MQEKTVYLDLVDTTGIIDRSISHWLIENNFAYPTKKLVRIVCVYLYASVVFFFRKFSFFPFGCSHFRLIIYSFSYQ